MNNKIKDSIIQFVKFNFVGIVNTVFTYCIYSLMIFLTNNYTLAICVDYSVGIISSFFLNKHITFKNKDKINILMILKMILSYVPSFILNLISLHFLIGKLNWNKYFAQLVTAFFIAYISFILQKFFVFKNKNKSINIESEVE